MVAGDENRGELKRLASPAGDLVGDVDGDGIISLGSAGQVAWLEPLLDAPASVVVVENTVVLDRGGVREAWTNTRKGLQHTFEVDEATSANGVEVGIAVSGLTPSVVENDIAAFSGGGTEIRYGGLAAFDQAWRALPARFEVDGSTLVIVVLTDEETLWPVTIDPIAQSDYQALAMPTCSGCTTPRFGATIASGDIDNDGDDDIVVGAPRWDNGATNEGAAFVYRSNESGSHNGTYPSTPSITIEGNTANLEFGSAVALYDLDSDGKLDLVVGAPGADTDDGEVYVFRNTGAPNFFATSAASADEVLPPNQSDNRFGTFVAPCSIGSDGILDTCVGAKARVYAFQSVNGGDPETTADDTEDISDIVDMASGRILKTSALPSLQPWTARA